MKNNNAEDKAERVLTIYTKLKQGKIIYREELSLKYGVSVRTIQRDITDIQAFLQNQFMEAGNIQEIVFDKKAGGYRLQVKQTNELNGKAVLTVCKILLECRALTKAEMLPIVYSMTALCANDAESMTVKDMLCNEIQNYLELRHGQKLLDRLWDLEKAIKAHKYVEIKYKSSHDNGEVTQKVKPVEVLFSEFYFYLAAYRVEGNGEGVGTSDSAYLSFYRVDRIQDYTVLVEYFQVPYTDQFKEEELRKRVQFMQEGTLRKVEFQFVGNSLEDVLDRLPGAVIKRKDREGYIVEAETFGAGLEKWLRSQGESIRNIHVYQK